MISSKTGIGQTGLNGSSDCPTNLTFFGFFILFNICYNTNLFFKLLGSYHDIFECFNLVKKIKNKYNKP